METTTYKLIWTAAAVRKYLERRGYDPRHTISNYPAKLDSPWMAQDVSRYVQGRPWLLIDDGGAVVARG